MVGAVSIDNLPAGSIKAQQVDSGDPIGETGYGLHGGRNVSPMVHIALYGTRRGAFGPKLEDIKALAAKGLP